MKKRIIGLLWLIFILLCSSQSLGREAPFHPGELYDSSMALYHQGNYEDAIRGFSRIVQSTPASQLASYAQYMIGLCYLKKEKYEEAIRQLELYLKHHPERDRVSEAEKGIQMARERLKEKKPLSEVKRGKRRICVQVSYLEGKTLEEVDKKVKELKDAGVNTIIFRAFQNKGDRVYSFVKPRHEEGVYFKSDTVPVVDDILGKVADVVHRNGLEIFAWMTTRYAHYGVKDSPENRCIRYNFETKKMEMARGLNLFHPDLLGRLESLYRDLGRCPIDGILFQDDLILKHDEDFSAEANQAFLKEFGYPPDPALFYVGPYRSASGKYYVNAYTERFWIWANWKNRWLMSVAKRLMAAARESNPGLQFAINLYFEAVLSESNGMAWFSQTLPGALKNNFDYYAIMAYHPQAMRDRNIEAREAIGLMAEASQKAIGVVGDPSRVLMKVWTLDWKRNGAAGYGPLPGKEMEEILTAVLKQGEVSLAFVPYVDQLSFHSLKEKWTNK